MFWRNDALGTLGGLKMIGTDTVTERVWNTSPGQPGPQGKLHAYLLGNHADILEAMPDDGYSRRPGALPSAAFRRRTHLGVDRLDERRTGIRRTRRH
jgi:hypothetical protein